MTMKITTLLGGPCAGQQVDESFFDGRKSINVWPPVEPPTDLSGAPQLPPRLSASPVYVYHRRFARFADDTPFTLFAFDGITDEQVQAEGERLSGGVSK